MTRPAKRIAALGTPCGGTHYVTGVLTHHGVRVRHEHWGEDGIVCGFVTWGRTVGRTESLTDYQIEHTLRLIRHPLRCAETLPAYVRGWQDGTPWAHEDPRLSALRYWVLTHERIPDTASVLRIERFADDWMHVARVLGLPGAVPYIEARASKRQEERWGPMPWGEWLERDQTYARRGLDLVKRYRLEG